MSFWDAYEKRTSVRGCSKREIFLKRELYMLEKKLPETLSYHSVTINNISYEVAIANSSDLNLKTIYSTTKDSISGGEIIYWMDNYWLVVECDANSEVYTTAKIRRCNHILRWVDSDNIIHEQWCVIEDGSKSQIGEHEDGNFFVTRGDSCIAMTISKNESTAKFDRESRFLIDDPESTEKLAYLLTKPLKVGSIYNDCGVYNFILQEVVSTVDDNHELGIADYYKHFSKNSVHGNSNKDTPSDIKVNDDGRRVWL